jgi:tRNA (uracil-5-)-methyltransferase TRM9
VKSETILKLLELNHLFYQTFAVQFSSTRLRLQPGVRRIFEELPLPAHLLDLGCGNGNLAHALASWSFQGTYLGLDNSPKLLEEAQNEGLASDQYVFLCADLASPNWKSAFSGWALMSGFSPFDRIVAFAVLHHLPGEKHRLRLLREVRALLAPGGSFIHSEWQFLRSPRWRARILPWEKVGLSNADVDAGDYLLDWRHGGQGLRYVHHFTTDELAILAEQSGFSIQKSFYSDGEGGKLGFYQVWEPV